MNQFSVFLASSVFLIGSSTVAAEWVSVLDEDPMTDARRATIEYPGLGIMGKGMKTVVVRCGYSFDVYDALDIIVGWNEYFAEDPAPSLKFRFDKNNPSKMRPDIASSRTAMFIPDDQEREFLASMKTSSLLVMQATPYREGTDTWTVDLTGFEAAWNEHCAAIADNAPVRNFEVEPSSTVPKGRTCSPQQALDNWKQKNPGVPPPPPSVAPNLPCPDKY